MNKINLGTFFFDVSTEITRARENHPGPGNELARVLVEEASEFLAEIKAEKLEAAYPDIEKAFFPEGPARLDPAKDYSTIKQRQYQEAVQVVAMVVRLLEEGDPTITSDDLFDPCDYWLIQTQILLGIAARKYRRGELVPNDSLDERCEVIAASIDEFKEHVLSKLNPRDKPANPFDE